MNETLNPCSQAYIELARLKIFTRTARRSGNTFGVGETILNDVYERSESLGPDKAWLYPELLTGLAEALGEFSISDAYKDLNRAEYKSFAETVRRQADSNKSLAKYIEARGAVPVLMRLAECIHAASKVGARRDERVYQEVAELVAGPNTPEIEDVYNQLNQWAKLTQKQSLQPPDLLYELLGKSARLQPAYAILRDLLQRLTNLVYVPLVVDDHIGICVPIEIQADYDTAEPEPFFFELGDQTQPAPTWLNIEAAFVSSIKKARRQACKMLEERGCRPQFDNFKISIGLPDFRVGTDTLTYDQGSLETPAALALFCQHKQLRDQITLSPLVITTGPISSQDSLRPKCEAFTTTSATKDLLVTTTRWIDTKSLPRMAALSSTNHNAVLKYYLSEAHSSLLNKLHTKILTYGTEQDWNGPLLDAERRDSEKPLLLPLERHQERLRNDLDLHHAVQFQGLSGIGKTWLLAQWLASDAVQSKYDTILYTSLLNIRSRSDTTALSNWATAALENLAQQLANAWGHKSLYKQLIQQSRLRDATQILGLLEETLSSSRILWVIDNGENLLNEDGAINEPRFGAMIKAITNRSWENAELLFVSNRRLELSQYQLHVCPLDQGFSKEEALQYLENSKWRFPDLNHRVAETLAAYPRALALIVGLATDYTIPEVALDEILESLASEEGQGSAIEKVCDKILGHLFSSLRENFFASWWMLLTSSTFVENFNIAQARFVFKAAPPSLRGEDPINLLSILEKRNLVNWGNDKWWMHGLVRRYCQEVLNNEKPRQFKNAHGLAGRYYFPLRELTSRRDRGRVAWVRGVSLANCTAALYHYEKAKDFAGQRAVFEYLYETRIERAKRLLQAGDSIGNPKAIYSKAERILKDLFTQISVAERIDYKSAARLVSPDINYLMATALHRQEDEEKYGRAALHYRTAIDQGKREVAPLLVSLLCDMTVGQLETDPFWLEAVEFFNEIREEAKDSRATLSYEGIGESYEKIAARYLELNPTEAGIKTALAVVLEAVKSQIEWDGIYLVGAQIAKQLSESENNPDVETWLKTGCKLFPQSWRLWQSYYLVRAKQGAIENVPVEFRETRDFARKMVSLSQELMEQSLLEAARRCLNDSLGSNVTDEALWLQLGRIYLAENDKQAALATFRQGIEKSLKAVVLYLRLGELESELGEKQPALATFKRGIEKNPKSGALYLRLGELESELGERESARATFKQGIENGHKPGPLYLRLGELESESGEKQAARATFKQGIEKDPDVGALYLRLGEVEAELGNKQAAAATFNQGLERSHHPALYLKLGEAEAELGDKQAAIATFRHGIEKNPSVTPLYLRLAEVQFEGGDKQSALDTLSQGIEKIDHASALYLRLAEILGATESALLTLKQGVEKNPRATSLYLRVAELEETLSDTESALLTLKQGVQKNPSASELYLRVAELEETLGDAESALLTLKEGVEKNPSAIALYLRMAELEETSGDPESALHTLKQGVEENPSAGELYLRLAELEADSGDMQLALSTLKKGK